MVPPSFSNKKMVKVLSPRTGIHHLCNTTQAYHYLGVEGTWFNIPCNVFVLIGEALSRLLEIHKTKRIRFFRWGNNEKELS